MNLRRAISYPYQNMPKIVTMVLILGIALVAFASMIERGEEMRASWQYESRDGRILEGLGLAGLILVFPCFITWLMGYGLDVIRQAGAGYRSLPPVHIFWNTATGLGFWFSRLVWGGLGMLIIGLLQALSPLGARQWPVWDLALLVFALVFTCESVSAAARSGMERRLVAAFAFPQNLAFLLGNKSAFAGLIARLLLLNAAYVIANNAFVQTMTWIDRSLRFDSYLIYIAIFCVGVLVFLLQYMSSLHLIGQFAYNSAPVGRRHHNKSDYDQE
ncbi:MAG: hypothetical protein OXG39_17555 [Chloroflexi bacterium]|nr:hypothetical protein [Chloroflexota bacterium]